MIDKSALDPRNYDYSGWTAADLAERFGSIPILRVCMSPPPGTATEADVVDLHDRTNRLFELVDGTLVEKVMGTYESYLAMVIARFLGTYVAKNKLGIVLGADGMLRISPGVVRIPDVSFISRDQMPHGLDPEESVAGLVPDIAIEIISAGNTRQEMDRKLAEYLQNGVRLVWYVYPRERSAHVYTSLDERIELTEADALDGGSVLPGFGLSLADLFEKPF